MNVIATYYPDAQTLISEGWKLLVEQSGIRNATQFVVLLERGKGDSIKEIAAYWGNSSIEEIWERVKIWKSQVRTA